MNDTKYEIVKFINNDIELDVNVSPSEDIIWLTKKGKRYINLMYL
ncbi:MAG: hypothetical protein AB7V00_05975 [Bacilli bacterium]